MNISNVQFALKAAGTGRNWYCTIHCCFTNCHTL